MYNIALEYDDASPSHPIGPRMWQLLQGFKDNYPDYKVTLFTVPAEVRWGKGHTLRHEDYKAWVKVAKKAYEQGWLNFALHGFTHVPKEFETLTYESAYKRISWGKELFESCGLPLLPIFKAPNWLISEAAEKAAEDLGFTVVKDLYYDWNLKDRVPRPSEFGDKIIIGHGHVQDGDGCFNGISETSPIVRQLPSDTKFYFLDKAL